MKDACAERYELTVASRFRGVHNKGVTSRNTIRASEPPAVDRKTQRAALFVSSLSVRLLRHRRARQLRGHLRRGISSQPLPSKGPGILSQRSRARPGLSTTRSSHSVTPGRAPFGSNRAWRGSIGRHGALLHRPRFSDLRGGRLDGLLYHCLSDFSRTRLCPVLLAQHQGDYELGR